MPFRRRRFVDVVERQLDLFAEEHADLVREADEALRAYDDAERDEAEDRYGDYLLVVEAGQDELVALREAYASNLDFDAAVEYGDTFNRLARKRFPRFGLELE